MVGKYFSVEYMRKNILKQSESEIAEMDKQIKQEIDDGIISSLFAQTDEHQWVITEDIMTEEVKTFIDNLATGDNANAGEAFKTALRQKVG